LVPALSNLKLKNQNTK